MKIANQICVVALIVLACVAWVHFQGPGSSIAPVGHVELVLVAAETSATNYTKPQYAALASAQNGEVHKWANEHTKGIRTLDPDQDASGIATVWQEGFASAKTIKLPNVSTYDGSHWSTPEPFADSTELKHAIGDE